MLNTILTTCQSIKDNRTIIKPFLKVSEEVGELAQEINIDLGMLNKSAGKDGILGEACDAIISLVDVIYLDNPSITDEEIQEVIQKKLAKWNIADEH